MGLAERHLARMELGYGREAFQFWFSMIIIKRFDQSQCWRSSSAGRADNLLRAAAAFGGCAMNPADPDDE